MTTIDLNLDLGDLNLADVELLLQAGAKGMPEYAASCETPTTSEPEVESLSLTDTPCCTSCGICKSCSCSTPS